MRPDRRPSAMPSATTLWTLLRIGGREWEREEGRCDGRWKERGRRHRARRRQQVPRGRTGRRAAKDRLPLIEKKRGRGEDGTASLFSPPRRGFGIKKMFFNHGAICIVEGGKEGSRLVRTWAVFTPLNE